MSGAQFEPFMAAPAPATCENLHLSPREQDPLLAKSRHGCDKRF